MRRSIAMLSVAVMLQVGLGCRWVGGKCDCGPGVGHSTQYASGVPVSQGCANGGCATGGTVVGTTPIISGTPISSGGPIYSGSPIIQGSNGSGGTIISSTPIGNSGGTTVVPGGYEPIGNPKLIPMDGVKK